MSIEAMKLALEMVQNKMFAHAEMYLSEAIEQAQKQEKTSWTLEDVKKSWKSGYEAGLEQAQKQEPVAWMDDEGERVVTSKQKAGMHKSLQASFTNALVRLSPQRQWVGLTDSDTDVSTLAYSGRSTDYIDGYEAGMEAAEAKLKEKNT